MLGIARAAGNQEQLWETAKRLYLSPDLARELYATGDIITPVRSLWSDPVFAAPDPYFSGQRKGLDYIRLAPDVPNRTSSPYNTLAKQRVQSACLSLGEYAERTNQYRPDQLHQQAMQLLREAERQVRSQMDRNVFLNPTEVAAGVQETTP